MKQININPELNIQCYEDILSKIEECRAQYSGLSEDFEGIKIGLFDTERDNKKRRKERLKQELAVLKDSFSNLDNLLATLTTFDASLLIPFVAEYLSRNTFERYLTIRVKRYECYGRSSSLDYFYFICNAKDVLSFQACGLYPDKLFDYSIKDDLTQNYIPLLQQDKYTLMDANGLTSGFKNFPELAEAARRIINIRLENPRIDEEECLNLALNGLLSNEATKKDIKPYNRTNKNGQRIKEMTLKELFSSQRR